MGLIDSIKNIMSIPEEDDYEEEFEAEEEKETRRKPQETAPVRRETTPRVLGGGKAKNSNNSQNQMQVVLVKPDRYEDVKAIADHLNEKKTVILNLEACEREVSRRIIDFLSGAAYANHGNIRKVAVCTFVIAPSDVDVMGELALEDFEDNRMYF